MQKLSRSRSIHDSKPARKAFSCKSPLITAIAALSLLSCDPKIPEKPEPPKVPAAMEVQKDSGAASKPQMEAGKPSASRKEPERSMASPRERPREPAPSQCSDNLCRLHKQGYRKIAEIIMFRSRPYKKKMRLTSEEADRAAGYLLNDLPSMRKSRRLLNHLPKTTVELIRSVNERGVERKEAEKMADYLYRFLSRTGIGRRGTFDECISHVIGREWHQIDYSGEGMTWQGQKKFYAPAGVLDLKTANHMHHYLKVEVTLRYFKKLFRPRGRLPPAPE